MEATDHINDIAVQPIIEGVGETTEKSSSKPYRDLGEGLRKLGNEVDDLLQGTDEVIPQAQALTVVPLLS